MSSEKPVTGRFGLAIYTAVLTASLGFNVYLANAHRSAQKGSGPSLAFVEGDSLLSLRAVSAKEPMAALSFGSRMIVYVFSPTCSWCKRDLDNLRALNSHASRNGIRTVAVTKSTIGLRDFQAAHELPCDIFTVRAEDAASAKLSVTPQTLVVGEDGIVRKAFSGALGGDKQKEAERYFALRLPGVAPPR